MKVALTTFFTNSYEELAAITIPVMEIYCAKHGYDLNINKIANDKSFHFVKTVDTRKLLDKYDVVMGIEADVLITNHNIKVEDFLDDENELYITEDINGINFGAFIARSSAWSKELFDKVNKTAGYFGDEQNFFEVIKYPEPKIKICKHPCFNSIFYEAYSPSYGRIGYKDGDVSEIPTLEQGKWEKEKCFTCHLPGKTLEERIKIFSEIKQHIIYE